MVDAVKAELPAGQNGQLQQEKKRNYTLMLAHKEYDLNCSLPSHYHYHRNVELINV